MANLWDVIVPEAGTNLVQNPNANVTGGLTAIGAGTVSRVTTYSYLGSGCHRIQASADNTGGYLTLTACANADHYVTLRINSASDIDAFDVSLDNATWNDMTLLSTEGNWWVYGVSIPAAQASASTALRIQQKGAGAIDLYIGFAQVEQNSYPTTPILGSLEGFLADGYKWAGSANASSSIRSAQERSGGKVVDLHTTYSVRARWANGIGMAPAVHHTQGRALLPGMSFTGQKVMPRVIDITAVMGTSYAHETVHSVRKDLIDALKLDRVIGNQPTVMRYRGALSTKPIEFYTVLDSDSLSFQSGGQDFDVPIIRLIGYEPYGYELGEESKILTTGESVSDADYCIKRISGDWSNISTTFDGTVYCFAKAANGNIYIGGNWAADVSTAADGDGIGIIEYNPTTGALTSIDGGLDGNKDVFDMAVAPNGDLYIVGDFTNAGGVAAADYCAYYDISAGSWTAMGTGLGGAGKGIVIGQDGSIYISGNFVDLTDANGDYITKWTGAAFVSLGTGLDDEPSHGGMAIHPNGDLYVVGEFFSNGDVSVVMNGIARWDGSAWNALGTGLADSVAYNGLGLAISNAGLVYVTGTFESADGVDAENIAVWNGKTFEPLDVGLNDYGATLAISEDGLLYVGGNFTTAGGLPVDRFAVWNGSTWVRTSVDLPGSPIIQALLLDGDDIYLGYSTSGTAGAPAITIVTNSGSAVAYPVFHVGRSGGSLARLESITNYTTGATVYFNYSLLDGEELAIDFRPGHRSVKSSLWGEVGGRAILRGSNVSEFYLLPGSNNLAVGWTVGGGETLTRYLTWRTTHEGADGVAA